MEKMLQWNGEPILYYSLELPEIPKEGRSRKVSAYYRRMGNEWTLRWEGELFQRAVSALVAARERSKPFEPWNAELSSTVTYYNESLWSLHVSVTETTHTERPYRYLQGDTWNLRTGAPLTLASFFEDCPGWRREMFEEIKRQTQERIRSKESLLDPDAGERLEREFDPSRFYLTEEGLMVFYPMETLGSSGEGFPSFLLKKACAEGHNGI